MKGPTRSTASEMPTLHDFQQRFVQNIKNLMATSYYRKRPALDVLDAGCDTSGRQMRHLSELTGGRVVGINNAPGFPSPEAVDLAGEKTSLINMDGMALNFPDESFDLVLSANVLEHVSDPAAYIRECGRVLKRNGIAYFETAPLWSGPRGHHIHPDMIADNCPAEPAYRNDGSVIPDWGHLNLTQAEMRSVLAPVLQPPTVDYILDYIYASRDVNRCGWGAIRRRFEKDFPSTKFVTWGAEGTNDSQMPRSDGEDHSVLGFSVIAKKEEPKGPAAWLARRLIWRLRKMGL